MIKNSIRYTIAGKSIKIYPSSAPNQPIIYLNTFSENGESIYKILAANPISDFSLVVISGLNWEHDMSPWAIPPISAGAAACTGGADEYLQLLTDEIVPQAEAQLKGDILWRGIAGYSLAGLFAVYSLYQTDLFTRAASMSGSLWYPGFEEYIFTHEMQQKPAYMYFSLGDRESRTRNPYLKVVQENTGQIADLYKSKDINTAFELNTGGHYKQVNERTAAGITCLLKSRPLS